MNQLNPQLLNFFTRNHRPGAIGLVGTGDTLGLAVREGQYAVTRDGKASLWSHCFIMGELRWDLRGPDNSKTRSPYIFESDLQLTLFKPQLRNGAQENWIGKWCKETVENAAIIDFNLAEEKHQSVLATALQAVDEQVLYSIQELLGTWLAIITRRQWERNLLDDPHAMYCSAFVRHCYKEAGADFVDGEIGVSNTTPEDIAQAGIQAGALKMLAG